MVHKSAAMDFLLLKSIAAGRGGHDFQLSDILLLLIHIRELKLPSVTSITGCPGQNTHILRRREVCAVQSSECNALSLHRPVWPHLSAAQTWMRGSKSRGISLALLWQLHLMFWEAGGGAGWHHPVRASCSRNKHCLYALVCVYVANYYYFFVPEIDTK